RRWAALSARYDAPAARAAGSGEAAPGDEQAAGARQERALWEALDRGEDPTQRSS
ncbi:MAG: hypothetical protein JWN08_463, partial [Frankiales bacterium]|nr:hypothetical protein [Frankiales bacterium]